MNAKEKLKALINGEMKVSELRGSRPVHFLKFKQGVYLNTDVYWEQRQFATLEQAEAFCNTTEFCKRGDIKRTDNGYIVTSGRTFARKSVKPCTPNLSGIVWDLTDSRTLLFVDEIPDNTKGVKYAVMRLI